MIEGTMKGIINEYIYICEKYYLTHILLCFLMYDFGNLLHFSILQILGNTYQNLTNKV